MRPDAIVLRAENTNGLKLRVDLVDEAVLRAIGGDVLRPVVVSAVLDGVFEALRPEAQCAAVERLRAELADVDRQWTAWPKRSRQAAIWRRCSMR